MDNYFEDHLGTSFGFEKSGTEEGRIVNGIITDGHSFRDIGLYPRNKPVILPPEIQSSEYEVPGRDGTIDTTEALDGVVHYKNRVGTFPFTLIGNRSMRDVVEHFINNKIHGRRRQIVLDEEPDGYYEGRLRLDEIEHDKNGKKSYYTIVGDLDPYKYEFATAAEDWLWDPFSFEHGVVRAYDDIQLAGTTHVTIIGSGLPVVPDIYVYNKTGTLTVTYGTPEHTVTLDVGSNEDKLTDLILRDDSEVVLTFSGTGIIKIDYKTGWL